MGNFIKHRKNKKFSYTPRFYEHDGEGSPFQIEPRFDKFRKTMDKGGIKQNFASGMEDLKTSDPGVTRRLLIIIAALVLLFLYFIDFDLSIFTLKS